MRTILSGLIVAVTVFGLARAQAEDVGTEIDFATFGREVAAESSEWDDRPLEDVAWQFGDAPRRVYLSGMIGPSMAQVTSPDSPSLASDETLFATGGALGVAFERANGQLRLEVEGMGRSTYDAPFNVAPNTGDTTILTNNWSAMTNAWRDFMLNDRFGIYGGGGIGAGGYILGEQVVGETTYADPGANFAWQVGGGLLWEINHRLTFDVGYRYFQINTITQPGVRPNQFAASELMFTLRLYEPFRTWRR